MAVMVGRGYTPKFDQPHLLAGVCVPEEFDLRVGQHIIVYTVSGEDYCGGELVGLRGLGCGAGGLLLCRGNVCRVVVMSGDVISAWPFSCWCSLLLLRRNVWRLLLEGHVVGEERCELFLRCHVGRGLKLVLGV